MFAPVIYSALCTVALSLFAPTSAVADDRPTIDDLYVGDEFKYPLRDIHPTQAAVGIYAVEQKLSEMEELDHEELRKYLKKRPIPVVAAPNREFYMIDHHHQALAALRAGRENAFYFLEADFSKLADMDAFWKRMRVKNWVRELGPTGKPIVIPRDLPKKITGMKNDPYRSLAYYVREGGGYRKTNAEFAEFLWADFFRSRVSVGNTRSKFDQAVEKALKIAHSAAAKHLPGWSKKPLDCASWFEGEED